MFIVHTYCIRPWLLVNSAFDKTMLLSLNTILKVHKLGKENLCSTNIRVSIVSLEGLGHKNLILIEGFYVCEDYRDLVKFFPCQTELKIFLGGKRGIEDQHIQWCEGKTCSIP